MQIAEIKIPNGTCRIMSIGPNVKPHDRCHSAHYRKRYHNWQSEQMQSSNVNKFNGHTTVTNKYSSSSRSMDNR